jgi:hypothetical protein
MKTTTVGPLGGMLALAASGILFAACGSSSAASTPTNPHKARAAVLTAYHYVQHEKSVSFTGTSSVATNGGSISTSVNGYAVAAGSGVNSINAMLTETVSIPGTAHNLTVHQRIANGEIFQQIPASERGLTTLSGATWVQYPYTPKSTSAAESSTQTYAANPTATLQLLLGKGASQIKTLGKATIDGHTTTEYEAQINFAKELAQLKQTSNSSVMAKSLSALNFDGPAQAKVWLDSSGRVRQLSLEIFASITKTGNPPNLPLTIKVNADYTHYGAHFPSITAPTSGVIPLSTFQADLAAAHPTTAS